MSEKIAKFLKYLFYGYIQYSMCICAAKSIYRRPASQWQSIHSVQNIILYILYGIFFLNPLYMYAEATALLHRPSTEVLCSEPIIVNFQFLRYKSFYFVYLAIQGNWCLLASRRPSENYCVVMSNMLVYQCVLINQRTY